jgi:hypothetical protein
MNPEGIPSRNLRLTLVDDESLFRLSDQARVLLVHSVLLADDHGDLPFYPAWLGAHVWGDTHKRGVERAADDLVHARRVEPYAVGGTRYAYIVGWTDPLSAMYQLIKYRRRPRYPQRSQDDRSLPQWFPSLRRVFIPTLDESGRVLPSLDESGRVLPSLDESGPPLSESGRVLRSPAESGLARARDLDLDQDQEKSSSPLLTQRTGVNFSDVFERAIGAVTGHPFALRGPRTRAFELIVETHGPNGVSTRDEQAAWLYATVVEWASGVTNREYGFKVGRLMNWLNAGRPKTGPDETPPETEAHTMSRPLTPEERAKILAEEQAFREEIARREGGAAARAREIPPPIPLATAAVVAGADALGTALEGMGGVRRAEDRQEGETEAAYIERRRREQLEAATRLAQDDTDGGT